MVMKNISKLTLDQLGLYRIKTPGDLTESLDEWVDQLKSEIESDAVDNLVTVIMYKLEQAALLGVLRCLYALGLPLISVVWIDDLG